MSHLYDLHIFNHKNINARIVRLESSLVAFSSISGVPVSFFSESGKYMWSNMEDKRICSANHSFGSEIFPCTRNLMSSMKTSLSLPEVYIFMCNSDFINLCHPLILDDRLYGFIIAGPIAMGNSIEKLIEGFSHKLPDLDVDSGRLIQLLRDIKLFSPKEINFLTTLFSAVVRVSLPLDNPNDIRRQRYDEQSALNTKLMRIKKEQLSVDYPHDSENALIETVRAGDTGSCRKKFGKYVEDILVFEQGNMSITKLRLVAFFTQLLKQNDSWQESYDNLYRIEKINDAHTIKEIMESGYTLIYSLTESMSETNYSGSSDIIKQVIIYLNTHYSEAVSLKDVADMVHISPPYLSALFKKETGKSLVSHLNDIRLARSKKLLSDTSMSITEICMASGFSSPSYFSKIFRIKYGLTPKQYRHTSL